MIRELQITLAQGLALHAACVEVSAIEVTVKEQQISKKVYHRISGNLQESAAQEGDKETLISSITFKADAWVNVNTKEKRLPSFDLVDKNGNDWIKINLEDYPEISDHLDNGFSEEATDLQRLEGTCEKFIKSVLVHSLKS